LLTLPQEKAGRPALRAVSFSVTDISSFPFFPLTLRVLVTSFFPPQEDVSFPVAFFSLQLASYWILLEKTLASNTPFFTFFVNL
jgi:hypothetical protein